MTLNRRRSLRKVVFELQKCNRFGPHTHGSRDSDHAQWPRRHYKW